MKLTKIVLIGGGLVVILIVVAVVALVMNLGTVVRKGIEQTLTYVLQVEVKVGRVHVEPTAGRVEIHNLVIGNPKGFKSDEAMEVGTIEAEVDIKSFGGAEPTIRLIRISDAAITLELQRGGSNLTRLKANAERLNGASTDDPQAEAASKPMAISKVVLEKNAFQLRHTDLDLDPLKLGLPNLVLNDLGGSGGKVTTAEAIVEVLKKLMQEMSKIADLEVVGELRDQLGQSLDALKGDLGSNLGEATKQLEGDVKERLEDLGKEADGLIERVRGGAGGLLKKTRE